MPEALDSAERVHYAMLRGELPRITMMQCAHTWGAQTVMDLAHANELRGDLQALSDLLADYQGDTVFKQAQAAIEMIDWLKNELAISQHNEHAFRRVFEQEQVKVKLLDLQLGHCRRVMEANDPMNARTIFGPPNEEEGHEQTARQTTGAAGTE